jgi:hypothetical protein
MSNVSSETEKELNTEKSSLKSASNYNVKTDRNKVANGI